MLQLYETILQRLKSAHNYLGERYSEHYLLFAIAVSSLVFSKVVLRLLNDFLVSAFVSTNFILIPVSFDDLYQGNYLQVYGIVVAVIGTLFVPPLISIYGLAKNSNYLIKLIIVKKYSHWYIARIITYFLAILISWNWIYWFFICLFLLIEVFLLYRDYYEFTFKPGARAIIEVRKILNTSNSIQSKYDKSYSRYSQSVGSYLKSRSGVGVLLDYNGAFSFESDSNVIGFDEVKLLQFLDGIYDLVFEEGLSSDVKKDILKYKITDSAVEEGAKPFLEFESHTEANMRSFQLLVTFNVRDKELIRDKLGTYRESFEKIFLYEKSQKIYSDLNNYFKEFSLHAVDLIKNNRSKDFKEEVELLSRVLNENLTVTEVENIVPLIRGLHSIVQGVDLESGIFDRGQKQDFYELWEDIFRALTKVPVHSYVKFATYVLVEGVVSEFWPESKSNSLDRRLTSFFNYSNVDEVFVESYLDALCEKLVNFKGDIQLSQKLINFLLFVRDDFKDSCKTREGGCGESCKIYKIANLRIVALSAYASKYNLDFKNYIFQKIDDSELLGTLHSIYTSEYGEIKSLWWEDTEFDRHGVGPLRTFSTSVFYKEFLLDYLGGKNLSFLKGQTTGYEILTLLKDLKEELEDPESVLEGLINGIQDSRDDDIIASDLSEERLENFVQECARGYNSSNTLAKLFSRVTKSVEGQDRAIGYNVALPKDLFIGDSNVIMGGLGHYGSGIAKGEDKSILKFLKGTKDPVKVTNKEFYENEVVANLKKGPELLILGSNVYSHEIFDWSGQCLLNDKLFRKFEVRDEFFNVEGKSIRVMRVPAKNEGFALFLNKLEAIEIEYYPVNYSANQRKYEDSNLFFLFEDLAKLPSRVSEIIGGTYFSDDDDRSEEDKKRHLSLRVGVQIYLNSNIRLKEGFEIEDVLSANYILKDNVETK